MNSYTVEVLCFFKILQYLTYPLDRNLFNPISGDMSWLGTRSITVVCFNKKLAINKRVIKLPKWIKYEIEMNILDWDDPARLAADDDGAITRKRYKNRSPSELGQYFACYYYLSASGIWTLVLKIRVYLSLFLLHSALKGNYTLPKLLEINFSKMTLRGFCLLLPEFCFIIVKKILNREIKPNQ